MENAYWENKMPEENLSGISSWQSISLVIELDLRGIERPKSFSLSEVPTNMLQVQKPETAQIFLCASSKDAKRVFQSRQIKSSVEYIERVTHDFWNFQYGSAPSGNGELLMPYDPRCLADWLSIQPGQVSKLLLPEYVTIPSQTSAYQLVVYSQVHMARGAENRYMVVWFDFREDYQADDIKLVVKRDDLTLHSNPASTWQRHFALQSQGLLNGPIRQATDFPSLMMLDLLRTDVMSFEKIAWTHHEILPLSTRTPEVRRNLEKRLDSFELIQSMIFKAEHIHRFIGYMNSPQALDIIADESRSSYEESLRHLEIGSLLLIQVLTRHDEVVDKRLTLHGRFAQLRQASSLSALTYCAAFFLPLSLAATFLSMQTRAKDLRWIVYDYCGITSIFCTIAVLIYFLSWVLSDWKTGRLNKRLQNGKLQLHLGTESHIRKNLLGVAWVSMVASFLVGMLYDLRLGLILLAPPVALVVLPALCVLAIYVTIVLQVRLEENGGLLKLLRTKLRLGGSKVSEPNVA